MSVEIDSLNENQAFTDETNEEVDNCLQNDENDNTGWANVLSKLRNKNGRKCIFLSQRKAPPKSKVQKLADSSDCGFEIVDETGQKKILHLDSIATKEKFDSESEKQESGRRNLQLKLRSKPTWQDIERERALQKKARSGVVQLFNAIRMQQRDLKQQLDEAGPLDSKRDAVLNNIDKRKFLDVLMSSDRRSKTQKAENSCSDNDSDSALRNKKKSEWGVLQDNYMTTKKSKHWDEESESGNENLNSEDDEGDSTD